MPADAEQWLTIDELATRWRVSYDTALRRLNRGELRGKRIGRQWRIHSSAVEEYERVGKAPDPRAEQQIETDWLGLQQA
jgi:excisionase family DNA binding protein